MKRLIVIIVLIMITAVLFFGCSENSNSNEFGIGAGNGLSASATSLSLLKGTEGTTFITGGMEPYSVKEITNSAVLSVQFSGRELQVTAVAEGTCSIKVTDSSSPPNTIVIAVTVALSFTANAAGSLSFTSNRGDYSVNGIAEYSLTFPASGFGAIAMLDFESLYILSYKVNSPTNIDLTLLEFVSNTSDYSGTFLYPGAGKKVFISYLPNSNPNDSSFLNTAYVLASSATATVESITSATMKGTFSGNGYYINKGVNNLNQAISVSNGIFTVPIIHTGLMEETTRGKNVFATFKKMLRYISAQ